jgi:hypothetical protein
MIAPGLRVGLQEWAVCCRALAEGRTVLLIRKGGIHEPRGGLFTPEHGRFALLPSFLHQAEDRLRPPVRGEYLAQVAVNPQPGRIPVAAVAEVMRVWRCSELARILALGDELLWSDNEISARFAYRGQPWLYVLGLRVQRLGAILELPDRASYGGCRSWIQLEDPVPVESAQPVLSESEQQQRLARVETLLGSSGQLAAP